MTVRKYDDLAGSFDRPFNNTALRGAVTTCRMTRLAPFDIGLRLTLLHELDQRTRCVLREPLSLTGEFARPARLTIGRASVLDCETVTAAASTDPNCRAPP